VDKKNSDFTRVGTNFVYNLQGRKESKIFRGQKSEGISGISGIRSIRGKIRRWKIQRGENSEVGVKARRQQRG